MDRVILSRLRCVVLGIDSAAEIWFESPVEAVLLVSFYGDRLATWTAATEWSSRFCQHFTGFPAICRNSGKTAWNAVDASADCRYITTRQTQGVDDANNTTGS
jgi:hypothetical protein